MRNFFCRSTANATKRAINHVLSRRCDLRCGKFDSTPLTDCSFWRRFIFIFDTEHYMCLRIWSNEARVISLWTFVLVCAIRMQMGGVLFGVFDVVQLEDFIYSIANTHSLTGISPLLTKLRLRNYILYILVHVHGISPRDQNVCLHLKLQYIYACKIFI